MIRKPTKREEELFEIIKPYFVYEGSGYMKEDAPEKAKKALQELREIAEEIENIELL